MAEPLDIEGRINLSPNHNYKTGHGSESQGVQVIHTTEGTFQNTLDEPVLETIVNDLSAKIHITKLLEKRPQDDFL